MVSNDSAKQAAGVAAASLVQNESLVGLGTGTTVRFFIEELSARFRQGLRVRCVATSVASWNLGKKHGLPMIDMAGITGLDIVVDGADEIDPHKEMIKGGGGALLREKILASISREMVVVVDSTKLVHRLGSFPLPVEVVPFAFDATFLQIQKLGFVAHCRLDATGHSYVTDGGNRIVDIDISKSQETHHEIHRRLCALPGVIDTGFFFGLAGRVIVGCNDGTAQIKSSLEV